jgi:hypothetical protein
VIKSLLKKLMVCLDNFSALFNVPWVGKDWQSFLQRNGTDRNIQMAMVTINKFIISRGTFDSSDACPLFRVNNSVLICVDIWFILFTNVGTADPMFSLRSNMITPIHRRWINILVNYSWKFVCSIIGHPGKSKSCAHACHKSFRLAFLLQTQFNRKIWGS